MSTRGRGNSNFPRYEDRGNRSRSRPDRGQSRQSFAGRREGGGGCSAVAQCAPGSVVNLVSNNFRLTFKDAHVIYLYDIEYTGNFPEDSEYLKWIALRSCKDAIEETYGRTLFSRTQLFAFQKVEGMQQFEAAAEGQKCMLNVKFMVCVKLDELGTQPVSTLLPLYSIFQSLIRKILVEGEFKQIGLLPRFYLPSEKKTIEHYNLEAWPGYLASTAFFKSGIYLNVDTVTKFVRKDTVLTEFLKYKNQEKKTFQEIKDIYLQRDRGKSGFCVLTEWGKQTAYQVDDIDFSQNPVSHTFEAVINGQTETISMLDYYKRVHNLTITDTKQPLLVVHKPRITLYLPPEFCRIPNLEANFTKDQQAMRAIRQYKINNPTERIQKIAQLGKMLVNNEHFKALGLEISADLTELKGTVLPPPLIKDPRNPAQTRSFDEYARGDIRHLEPLKVANEEWTLCYSHRDYKLANDFVYLLGSAQVRMGIDIGEPQYIEVPNSSKQDYIDALKSDLDPARTKFVMILLFNAADKHQIKGAIDRIGVPSQFALTRTIKPMKLPVASAILKQINAKVRLDLYRLSINQSAGTMFVGIDLINNGKGFLLGFTATNNAHATQCVTYVEDQLLPKDLQNRSKEEQDEKTQGQRTDIIKRCLLKALRSYEENCKGNMPQKIVIYRDGVGGPTMKRHCLSHELSQVSSSIKQSASGYNPELLYILVDKRINHRFFVRNGDQFQNPCPGTVVDTGLVELDGKKTFDFYMVPHKATVASALPVKFSVVFNETAMGRKDIETMSYHLCYSYFNFAGGIKVPHVCKYAEKAANYVHDIKGRNGSFQMNEVLEGNLHYL